MPARSTPQRQEHTGYQYVNDKRESHPSGHWRFSASPRRRGGDIRPIRLREPATLDPEPRHLFAERAARDVQSLHHGTDPPARFLETALDHRTFEGFHLLGKGKPRVVHNWTPRHE